MIAPPIGQQKVERNSAKIYARITHLMLFLPVYQLTKIILTIQLEKKIKLEQCSIDTNQMVNKTYLIQFTVRNITII